MKHDSPVLVLAKKCHKRNVSPPVYVCVPSILYTYSVKVKEMKACGRGPTIGKAKNMAALNLLRAWSILDKTITEEFIAEIEEYFCPQQEVVLLNQYCATHFLPMPKHDNECIMSDSGSSKYKVNLTIGGITCTVIGANKKEARAEAANKFLTSLSDSNMLRCLIKCKDLREKKRIAQTEMEKQR
ncbi:uncharacterized protein LOC119672671 [Teleopsis dalmanni]|uniref:uncharacterized protein LOC119672671 n=1 Tax=Teleopsis dalmanni TaxID=139649 RepID=UPI0018CE8CC6|nr:uncharacterized protein LOC119672671 [Teleopsis dalmanni]